MTCQKNSHFSKIVTPFQLRFKVFSNPSGEFFFFVVGICNHNQNKQCERRLQRPWWWWATMHHCSDDNYHWLSTIKVVRLSVCLSVARVLNEGKINFLNSLNIFQTGEVWVPNVSGPIHNCNLWRQRIQINSARIVCPLWLATPPATCRNSVNRATYSNILPNWVDCFWSFCIVGLLNKLWHCTNRCRMDPPTPRQR